ncbi:MAG TPA: stage II sporulation protein M [Candidatus Acidoferrum sp.]|nr:stage II sporulation protein M [Candidatus Acidoferrum sp.]
MIIDLHKFLEAERPAWKELENILGKLAEEPNWRMDLAQLKHFHYLYERASADLGKIVTFASEPETRRYLEALVARAYGEIHESREKAHRFRLFHWFFVLFPQTFRRHIRAFWLSLAVTLAGCLFGGAALALDPDAKPVLLPFEHLQISPAERVAQEEKATQDRLAGRKATFSAQLMTHNTEISIKTLALGATWGFGTILMLFYNGVILGAVSADYILGGQTKFLVGWLLPHGSFEIPAILIAGQGGLILGGALIGWGRRASLANRLQAVAQDLVILIFGVAVMLIWAGVVESFFSQYHQPVVPYTFKIIFGLTQLSLLVLLLARSGTSRATQTREAG